MIKISMMQGAVLDAYLLAGMCKKVYKKVYKKAVGIKR
jgi:hypothetical protein